MKSIREHRPRSLEQSVHPACEANLESLHSPANGQLVVSFDEQVDVIRQQRVGIDPKGLPLPNRP